VLSYVVQLHKFFEIFQVTSYQRLNIFLKKSLSLSSEEKHLNKIRKGKRGKRDMAKVRRENWKKKNGGETGSR
jgi:hypothetical protein